MLRSVLFNIAFYLNTILFMVLGSPLLLGRRRWAMLALHNHARTSLALQRLLAGTRMDVRGREHLPNGPLLVAAKHQSAWDTFALVTLFDDPAFVLKAELLRIPLYGWYCRKFGMIPVERASGASALRRMLRAARDAAREGRQIVIFPEGTRRTPGAPPDYKPGIVPLYEALKLPCVPIALNSGLYWPRRAFRRHPGTILIEILPPILPGLGRTEFMAELQERIESASAGLLEEAARSSSPPPIPAAQGTAATA